MCVAPQPVLPQRGGLLWARIAVLFLTAGAIAIILSYPDVQSPFDQCQFLRITGHECPACGITRGLSALIHGRFRDAFFLYPFAFPVALGVFIAVIGSLLPNRLWRRVMATRWMPWVLGVGGTATVLGIIVHWLLRIL